MFPHRPFAQVQARAKRRRQLLSWRSLVHVVALTKERDDMNLEYQV